MDCELQEARDIEQEILDLENLEAHIFDVKIGNSTIHTIEVGRGKGKPKLVLIHGYGGAAIIFWRLMDSLKEDYHIFAIDHPGTGLSSRIKIDDYSYENSINIFVENLDRWVQQVGIDEPFTALGHSLGAYLLCKYYEIKQPNIVNLILLSPAGFTHKGFGELRKIAKNKWRMPWWRRYTMYTIFYVMQKWNFSPWGLMPCKRKNSWLKNYYFHRRLRLSHEQATLFFRFFCIMTDQPESYYRSVGSILYFGRYSLHPICDIISELKDKDALPSSIWMLFGANDWMDKEDAKIKIQELDLPIKYEILEGCGHQVPFQNIDRLSDILLGLIGR